jgi:hypothetical protein
MPFYVILVLIFLSYNAVISSGKNNNIPFTTQNLVNQQVEFDAPNIRTWVYSSGILNQDLRTSNTPGFEWPINSGKHAIFTSGLSIAAMVQGQLREAMASYKGEYSPGHIMDSSGIPVPKTNSGFKIYRVKAGDNYQNSSDWANWGLMIPYGAPYVDKNNNNVYDPMVDSPGVKGAYQTLFVCLTDGFPESHTISEGFGGGTPPLFAELHMTAWSYSKAGFNDLVFFKWEIFNKNNKAWNSAQISFVSDPDLGCADDDFIGCDTLLKLGYCYNADNNDDCTPYNYGANPPAVGFLLLENAINKSVTPYKDLKMSSFVYFTNTSSQGPVCEHDPNGEQMPAYYMMKGIKKDQTPWVVPPGGASNVTKFCYSGNPVFGTGWTEGVPGNPTGSVWNCGGPNVNTGTIHPVNVGGDRRIVMSSGADNFTVAPGEKQTMVMVEFMVRGNSNFNSVDLLRTKAQDLRNDYLIGIENKGTETPAVFSLSQNYPNPFNPTTSINYQLSMSSDVKLVVYDLTGKSVMTLVNQRQNAGNYTVTFNGENLASGVYFYTLQAGDYKDVKRMVLIK